MARRRIAMLLLVAGLCGCGAVGDATPRPTPEPMLAQPERTGELKADSWRAQAAAEARLRAAIRRARNSTTVAGALRYALLTERITPVAHARLVRDYEAARLVLQRLDGLRATELAAVLGTVDSLAADHLLTPTRLKPTFLILRRNTDFWSRAAVPATGERVSFGPAVFQYYPGRGMQLQPLASWGRVNWLARTCLENRGGNRVARHRATPCPVKELRRAVDGLLPLAAHRGDFLAWEHYFSWGGGTPPWISGMTQATAVSALARASRALGEPRWRSAAHSALGAFNAAPPLGVDGGDHFLMYSFAPTLRIFNGELQAVSGIGEMASLWRDRRALALFRRGEKGARATVAAADTGAWSLYSLAGREATLDYHRLIAEFLGDMCDRTDSRVYCDARLRFTRYEQEPTRIGVAPLRRLRARHATTVRFSLSKISDVKVQLWRERRLTLSRDFTLSHGPHELDWTPPSRGRFELRIEAQGPSGPIGVAARSFRILLPKPKPKPKRKPTDARKPDRSEPRPEPRGGEDRSEPRPEPRSGRAPNRGVGTNQTAGGSG
jgi:hypothetical protein